MQNGQVTMTDVEITDCAASRMGGAIAVDANSSLTSSDRLLLSNNMATQGGGAIWVAGSADLDGTLTKYAMITTALTPLCICP